MIYLIAAALVFVLICGLLCLPVSAAEYRSEVMQNLKPNHPRIFLDDFEPIREKIRTDERAASWYAMVKSDADGLLEAEFVQHIPKGQQTSFGEMLIPVARIFMNRMYILSLTYQVERDPKYLDRLYEEAAHVAAFPDWDPTQFLTTAEITHGMAIAYDWNYNDLDEEQRSTLLQGIVEKGLNQFKKNYSGNVTGVDWMSGDNNWNPVCNASGVMGAIAIANEDPNLADYIIAEAIDCVQKAIIPYAPDGGFREGSNYWGYATNYLGFLMASIHDSVVPGTEFSEKYRIWEMPGVSETPEFAMYITGPTGAFNYGDSIPAHIQAPVLFWWANFYDKPTYAAYQADFTDTYTVMDTARGVYPPVLALVWYDPDNCSMEDDFLLDRKFSNTNDLFLRSGWEEDDLFVGMKGGSNQAPHGFVSVGAFCLDALGERWATMRGVGDYEWPGYFGSTDRYLYYIAKAEGNNTLVLNPDASFDQELTAEGIITAFESGEDGGYGVIDMTSAYSKNAKTAFRGARIFDDRSKIVIQDEITTETPLEVWWFMHTNAQMTFSADGKSVLMTSNGKQMVAKIASPAEATFMLMDAKLLPTSPVLPGQPTTYGSKLAIHMENMEDFTLTVEFEPVLEGEHPNYIPSPVVPMSEWTTESTADTTGEVQQSHLTDTISVLTGSPLAYVFGSYQYLDEEQEAVVPREWDGKLYLPAAFLREALGEEVPETGGREVDGITWLPVREICEGLGYQVTWQDGLTILSKEPIQVGEADAADMRAGLENYILVGGKLLSGFSPRQGEYTVNVEPGAAIPSLEMVTLNPNSTTRVTPAANLRAYACAAVTNGGQTQKYYFSYKEGQPAGSANLAKLEILIGDKERQPRNWLPVEEVTAGDMEDSTYGPGNTLDGNAGTRWSAEGSWIQFKLAEPTQLHAMGIAAYRGNERKLFYEICVSDDGENWETIFDGEDSGTSLYPTIHELGGKTYQYFRINCKGTTMGTWNSITEVRFYDTPELLEADQANWEEYFHPELNSNLFAVGDTVQLTTYGTLEDGSSIDIPLEDIIYTSGNTAVATVDENGLVTLLGPGDVNINITATVGRVQRSEQVYMTAQ